MARTHPGHTWRAADLVHEAYLRLVDREQELDESARVHFLVAAALAMRRVLVDHARRRDREKREGGWLRGTLTDYVAVLGEVDLGLVELDDLLKELGQLSVRQERILELQLFAGLTSAEVAVHLETSRDAVEIEKRMARAWIRKQVPGKSG